MSEQVLSILTRLTQRFCRQIHELLEADVEVLRASFRVLRLGSALHFCASRLELSAKRIEKRRRAAAVQIAAAGHAVVAAQPRVATLLLFALDDQNGVGSVEDGFDDFAGGVAFEFDGEAFKAL